MKITIDISELETLAELETELHALDAEFNDLLERVKAGKNDTDTPFVLQFHDLVERANKRASKKEGLRDYTGTINDYVTGKVSQSIFDYVYPRKNELIRRAQALQSKIRAQLPSMGGSGHISARKHMSNADINFDDIIQDIDKQIESQLANVLESERV